MGEVHLPDLDDEEETAAPRSESPGVVSQHHPPSSRSRSVLKIAIEVLLISTGVFLGLMGEQWRGRSEHREMAQEALRRFRTEIAANRAAIEAVRPYHVTVSGALQRYFAATPQARKTLDIQVKGIQPVFFARTAWDLALATQSLSYVDPELAFELSDIYTLQEQYSNQTRDVMLAMYLQPPSLSVESFFGALKEYYGDVVLWEPRLVDKYDVLTPKIERALSGG
jgi:hypothetical protein